MRNEISKIQSEKGLSVPCMAWDKGVDPENFCSKLDGLVKSRKYVFIVIPAKAGIQ